MKKAYVFFAALTGSYLIKFDQEPEEGYVYVGQRMIKVATTVAA